MNIDEFKTAISIKMQLFILFANIATQQAKL